VSGLRMQDFDATCDQFADVFLESITILIGLPRPRWWSAAQLIAAATDALGGARLTPNQETTRATFQAFITDRYPTEYGPYAEQLYKILRCGLLHAGRVSKHGRHALDPSLASVFLTHADRKPTTNADGTLVISVPHLHNALIVAFDDFRSSPLEVERTNFPLRFEIVLGQQWDEVAVDSLGSATFQTRSVSGSV
jgi:hypothetical protein